MYETTYHRASSVADAAAKISGAEDGKILAGGQTLIPTMKQRLAAPSDLVDIRTLGELQGIEASGGGLTIGAGVSHAEVATSDTVRGAIAAVADLAGKIGDPHVRHMGTIGGSIANNDPAADYPAAVLGLDGTVITNKRSIPAADFFQGLFETALEDDEIIVKVSFTVPTKAGYAKFPNPASRYAMCGVMAAQMADGSARVAVTGAGNSGVFRHAGMEAALAGNWSPDAVSGASVDAGDMIGDLHGSAEYRANLVVVMAKRAIVAAG